MNLHYEQKADTDSCYCSLVVPNVGEIAEIQIFYFNCFFLSGRLFVDSLSGFSFPVFQTESISTFTGLLHAYTLPNVDIVPVGSLKTAFCRHLYTWHFDERRKCCDSRKYVLFAILFALGGDELWALKRLCIFRKN